MQQVKCAASQDCRSMVQSTAWTHWPSHSKLADMLSVKFDKKMKWIFFPFITIQIEKLVHKHMKKQTCTHPFPFHISFPFLQKGSPVTSGAVKCAYDELVGVLCTQSSSSTMLSLVLVRQSITECVSVPVCGRVFVCTCMHV